MRVETLAALVNGALVLLMPLLMLIVLGLHPATDSSVTVVAPGGSLFLLALRGFRRLLPVLIPLSVLAVWRTHVYARRWQLRHDAGWGGVLEAGACAVAVELIGAAPGLVSHSAPILQLVAFIGIALALGLAVGVLLQATALLVLKLHQSLAR